jgi:hypothetical protein
MLIAGKISPSVEGIETTKDRVIRFVKLSMIMWILHIFLDFSWGPILLFWPIDVNLYDLSVVLRFENKPWLFFPLSLIGLIPNWGIFSITEGERLFFINLSNQERQAIYGQFLDLQIEHITLQVLVFTVWLVVIVFPAFRRKKNKTEKEEGKARIYIRKTWRRLGRHLTVLGLFILFLGILLGPTIGRERLISYQVNAQYVSTTSFFDPTLGVVFLNKPQTVTDFEFQSETGVVDYNTSLMITNNETFTTFFESYENMTQNYYD